MLTESRDLRTGDTPWDDDTWPPPASGALPTGTCDVAIVGTGISGAILAERLTAEGMSVVLLDRRPPGLGSTAASTAQVMWAMDVPLVTLAAEIGEAEAARRWRRVYASVQAFADRIDGLGLAEFKRECPTVYLAGDLFDASGLREEGDLHRKHNLPTAFLEPEDVAQRFDIAPWAALVSDGGFSIEPVSLTHALIAKACSRGALLCYPANVTALTEANDAVTLSLEDGRSLSARQVVMATGYERAALFLPPAFELLSTFVLATQPGTAPLWREEAMFWEASDPYLYLRSDRDGRVLIGGEDVDFSDALQRDALIQTKAGTISAKASALLGGKEVTIDRAWAATFGSSPDGLPAIGRAANMARVWLAAGFGGNGIAFSAMAADLLSSALTGTDDPDIACFDPYRFSP